MPGASYAQRRSCSRNDQQFLGRLHQSRTWRGRPLCRSAYIRIACSQYTAPSAAGQSPQIWYDRRSRNRAGRSGCGNALYPRHNCRSPNRSCSSGARSPCTTANPSSSSDHLQRFPDAEDQHCVRRVQQLVRRLRPVPAVAHPQRRSVQLRRRRIAKCQYCLTVHAPPPAFFSVTPMIVYCIGCRSFGAVWMNLRRRRT